VIQLTLRGAAAEGVKEAQEWLRTGEAPYRPGRVKLPQFDPRLELEDEGPECLESPREILQAVVALREELVREMEKVSGGSRAGRLPRRVLREPKTPEEGLALLQGRIAPEFTLPPLEGYFEDMEGAGVENMPPWRGEPGSDVEYMQTIDAIIACCRRAIARRKR
jgi:hypothetical protein